MLSGGQKQRIAIAHASLKDPSILLVDKTCRTKGLLSIYWLRTQSCKGSYASAVGNGTITFQQVFTTIQGESLLCLITFPNYFIAVVIASESAGAYCQLKIEHLMVPSRILLLMSDHIIGLSIIWNKCMTIVFYILMKRFIKEERIDERVIFVYQLDHNIFRLLMFLGQIPKDVSRCSEKIYLSFMKIIGQNYKLFSKQTLLVLKILNPSIDKFSYCFKYPFLTHLYLKSFLEDRS
ncbi:uncharacterized protein EV154DRAFT_478940 [Mucor mucedo]|uniref:uncharacterized protein n=1 Tax=Mucor mucedo TaxID=29922 RepID=UPI00221EBC0C|nr:uncharacterized protein EV154DRAFT_478940 [Mucor mucedo]KAI7893888.1 hypothetical protein EV154DRAFT_478940 [Mucor mucedo]